MINQDRPNLFSFATSELSQDAFICWLAAWADPKWQHADSVLHQTAQRFIASMIQKVKPDYDLSNLKTVGVRRQVEKLDILIEINKELPDKLAILVEDKTHTSNHSDQLNRYYGQIREAGYTEDQMIPLYFKTGYQSKFNTLGVFKTYLRSDFLEVLRTGKSRGVDNAIFKDFLQHLETLDAAIREFSTKNPKDWQADDWRGFFMVLYDSRGELYEVSEDDGANWDYVANPSGGFFGFWWYFKNLPDQLYTPYLQLEGDTLCFKIEAKVEAQRNEAREKAYYQLTEAGRQLNAAVERPKRMGNGRYMTVLRWKDDYRVYEDGKLAVDATLNNLKKAQQILDLAFSDN
ncbi:hypothetical protein HNV11_09310 [Spirosoma taeanense]|uniref:PD-(D/E)XK nuclease superfamily protein n=1 Tax=Spirosoma taeanense TaxID=2735870 RepID=A0A6M5Y7U4_9BACT|nr:PD-(D/E)XK nuclease family protein [Spirosoma taeanense]QJW89564.1 hypothetical protein HNV11_09310 [Spirosoma taeanense]